MQIEIAPRRGERAMRFHVLVDGESRADFGTRALALAYMDQLWEKRPAADKTLEQLWREPDF